MKEQEKLFNILKQNICEAPFLGIPNLQNPFRIDIGALGYAMGVILMEDEILVSYHL
jgi:hypothetical protein